MQLSCVHRQTERERHQRLLINLTCGINENALPCQIYQLHLNIGVGPVQMAEVKYPRAHNCMSYFFFCNVGSTIL